MGTARPASIDEEADRFERALKTSRTPHQLQGGLWDIWVDDPARAHHLIARFKDYPPTPAVRLKVAPAGDEFDQLGQQIADAARQIAMQAGGDRKTIIDQLRSYAMQLATPQQATKTTKTDPFIAAIQGDLSGWDRR